MVSPLDGSASAVEPPGGVARSTRLDLERSGGEFMVLFPVENAVAVGTGNDLLAFFNFIEQLGRDIHVTSRAAAVFHGHHRQLRSFLLYPVIEIEQLRLYLNARRF